MNFAAPLGLLALLALPAILFLHLFRRRLRERRVAGLFLFAPDALTAPAGRRRTRLLRTGSLLCELAAAAVLALWLGALDLGCSARAVHVVAVLDDSASMGARGPAGSFADRARRVVESALDGAGSAATATLVVSGPRPEIVAGPHAPAAEVRAALAAWSPRRTRHDPAAALDLGLAIAGASDRLLFVTDEPKAPAPPRYEVVAVGEPLANAAIVAARRVVEPGGEERLLLDVRAFGAGIGRVRVRVHSAEGPGRGALLAETDAALGEGSLARLALVLPPDAGAVTATIDDDALAIDGEATLLPDPLRIVGVASLLGEEETGRLRLDRALAAIHGARAAPLAESTVVLAPAAGALAPGRVELVIQATGPERSEWTGPFLLAHRHPLLAGVTLAGVVWSAGDGSHPGLPLVSAGDRTLVSESVEGTATRLWVDLDLARSNLPFSPDWPILLANVVERARAGLPGLGAANARVGDEIVWRAETPGAPAGAVECVAPSGARAPGRGSAEIGFPAREPGIHRIERSGREVARCAVRFEDASESDLTRCGAARRPAEAPPSPDEAAAQAAAPAAAERRVLAVLLLAALVADWLVLRRARTS